MKIWRITILIIMAVIVQYAKSDTKMVCPEGEFKQYYFGKYICRNCTDVYKNCNSCDPANLDAETSFCSSCRFFYISLSYDNERTAVVNSMKAREDGKINPDEFGWECSFNTPLLIFIVLGFLVVVGSSVGYYFYKRRLRIKEQIKQRREKERQWGRLIQ